MLRSWFFRAETFKAWYFSPSSTFVVGGKWRWAEGYKKLLEHRQNVTTSEAVKEAAAVLSRMGGIARAQALTAKQRSNIASKAAQTRWGNKR